MIESVQPEPGRSPASRTDAQPRFAPASQYRGVPDLDWWRNPTLWVGVGMVAGWTIGWVGYLTGTVPGWAAIAANTVADYLGFTVMHESVHRVNVANRRINDAIGWLPAFMLTFTYPVFRISHINHHAHTNDPDLDPDHWVSRRPRILLPFWLVTTAINYRVLCYRHQWGTVGQRRAQQVVDVVLVVGTLLAAWSGHLMAALVLYWIPWLISGLFLLYAFDFLPHYPFTSTDRYHDTRIQQGRIRHALLLGQSHHLIHHLWVSVPWFSYRKVFVDLEPQLRAQGARIE